MCGFCIEMLALDLSRVSDPSFDIYSDIIVQESLSLGKAVAVAATAKRTMAPSCVGRIARAVGQGDTISPEHCQLLLRGMHEGTPPYKMPVALMQWLAGEQVADNILIETATRHIEEFTSWWFGGQVLSREVAQDEGIWSPGETFGTTNIQRLWSFTPAVLASLGILNRKGTSEPRINELLCNLITGEIPTTPYFDGCDLWIQRQAVLDIFDRFGADGLLNAGSIRRFLWAYLIAKRPVPGRVIARLDQEFGANWMDSLL
jgi:hypothetical protein